MSKKLTPLERNRMTPDQLACAEMLAEWAGGWHHISAFHEFGIGICINFCGDLSTYDFNRLTRLVVLAHRDAIRIEIGPSGPYMVKIMAHRRRHGERKKMSTWEYHPGLADLIGECGLADMHEPACAHTEPVEIGRND